LEINAKHAYCYKCNNWVTNDNKYDQLQKLRDLLEQAQTNNWGKGEFGEKNTQTNSEIIKYQPNEAEFKKKDKINTFIQRWKLFTLAKAFNKWKEFIVLSKGKHYKMESSEVKLSEKEDSETIK